MHTDVLKLLRLQLMSLLTLNTLLFLSTTQNYISHYTRYTTYSMDQMPVATRSICTQVDLTEVWKMDYNGQDFTGKLTYRYAVVVMVVITTYGPTPPGYKTRAG